MQNQMGCKGNCKSSLNCSNCEKYWRWRISKCICWMRMVRLQRKTKILGRCGRQSSRDLNRAGLRCKPAWNLTTMRTVCSCRRKRVGYASDTSKHTGCYYVDCVGNVMAHAQKPDFVFRRNGRVNLNRRGRQFSRLLAAEVYASAVVMLDTPCSEVVWEYWLPTPFASFPFTSPPVRHSVPSRFNWILPHAFTSKTVSFAHSLYLSVSCDLIWNGYY